MCTKASKIDLQDLVGAASQTEAAPVVFIDCTSGNGFWWVGPVIWSIAAIIALLSLRQAEKIAQKRATLDFIERFESSKHYRDMRETFWYAHRTRSLTNLSEPKETRDKASRAAVLDYLNHYEIVAIGIKTRILSAEIYKEWMGGRVIRDWRRARSFIQRERWECDPKTNQWSYYERSYKNFEELVRKFKPDEPPLTEASEAHPQTFNPDTPSDEPTPRPR